MSTKVTAAPERTREGARYVPYRHVLHQHRAALRTAVTLTVLGAALAAGSPLWSAPGEAPRSWAFAIGDAVRLGLPLFAGVLVAGPMLAEELSSGTYRLAWTQSVTPARWLTAKLVVPAGVVLVLLVALSALLWWVRVASEPGPHGPPVGPAAIAFALFAVAFGSLAGLLVRRPTAAMALAVFGLVFALLVCQSQPMDPAGAQIAVSVSLLGLTAAAVAGSFLLVRRAARGDVR